MAKKILIRIATEKDIDDILCITKEAFEKYAFDLGIPEKVGALFETSDTLKDEIQTKKIFIGFLDHQPVGSIRVELLPGNLAYISRFGVKLSAQSCGMGGALVSQVVDWCKTQSVSAIALHTSAKMSSLIRFYYGKGFFIDSTSKAKNYVRALLIKELPPATDTLINYADLIDPSH